MVGASFAGYEGPSSRVEAAARGVFRAYFYGQLANVAKAAVWWSTFGVVAEALTKWQLAVGMTRLAFNVALIMVSPIAGFAADSLSIQRLLNWTTGLRSLIWCLLVPAGWYLLAAHLQLYLLFALYFLLLMLMDGLLVSFANVVDVDCGGLDTWGLQLGVSVAPALKEKYNRLHQKVFDLSFVFLTPVIGFAVWYMAAKYDQRGLSASVSSISYRQSENYDVAMLLAGVCLSFGTLSFLSLLCYRWSGSYAELVPQDATTAPDTAAFRRFRLWPALRERAAEIAVGCRSIVAEKPLCWRLTFLACETALEDAVVSVLFPQIALQAVPLLFAALETNGAKNFQQLQPLRVPGGWTLVNLMAVSLIAVGKFGGLFAGGCAANRWVQPRSINSRPYKCLTWSIFAAACSLMLFPVALLLLLPPAAPTAAQPPLELARLFALQLLRLEDRPRLAAAVALTLMLMGALSYFVFVTAPKVGFATLLHAVAVQGNVDSHVFAFVGTYVTAMDALVILLISWNFSCHAGDDAKFFAAMLATVSGYLLYGLVEIVLSPVTILKPVARRAELEAAEDLSDEYDDDNIGRLTHGVFRDTMLGVLQAEGDAAGGGDSPPPRGCAGGGGSPSVRRLQFCAQEATNFGAADTKPAQQPQQQSLLKQPLTAGSWAS